MTLVESMGVLTYEMRYLVSENWERVPSSQAELLFAIIGMVNCLGLGFCGKPALVFFWWPFAASRQPCPYERGIPNLRPQTKRCCSNFFRIRIFLGSVYLASFFPQMVSLVALAGGGTSWIWFRNSDAWLHLLQLVVAKHCWATLILPNLSNGCRRVINYHGKHKFF